MKNIQAEFIAGATSPELFPAMVYPEIAFIGRSNVGKSSLLNSIVQRKNLAHISSTPGKTQQINFFYVEDKWCLVDLPGYGYASTSKVNRAKWAKLNEEYLSNRENLQLVCLLVDSRHDPMELDIAMMEWLENNNKTFIVLLTKSDKTAAELVQQRKEQLEELLKYCKKCLEVLPYSAVSNLGRTELLAIIKRLTK